MLLSGPFPLEDLENMTARIGINGFGRMGRLALRAAWGWPDIEFVHINEAKGGAETAASSACAAARCSSEIAW